MQLRAQAFNASPRNLLRTRHVAGTVLASPQFVLNPLLQA